MPRSSATHLAPLAAFVVFAQVASAQTGELTLYGAETQIGVCGNRRFVDAAGVLRKTEYFCGRAGPDCATGPPCSVVTFEYDELGRLAVERHVERVESQSYEVRYGYEDANAIIRRSRIDADGVRRTETRLRRMDVGFRELTDLAFDQTGSYLVAMRGDVPHDVDLPDGWGEPVGGRRLGIALTSRRAPLAELGVWITLRNVGASDFDLHSLLEARALVVDAAGRRLTPVGPLRANGGDSWYPVRPGEAGSVYPAYSLAQAYPALEPGTYTVRVEITLDDATVVRSNWTTFEVLPACERDRPSATAPRRR